MTTLLVHIGTATTGWPTLRDRLLAERTRLADAGVWVAPPERAIRWDADVHQVAVSGEAPPRLTEWLATAVAEQASYVMLGSERLEDGVRDAAVVNNLVSWSRGLGADLTLTLLLRDQLAYLNALYCQRVRLLQTAGTFSSFLARPNPVERFDYRTAYGPLLDRDDLTVRATPYDERQPSASYRELLTASGVPTPALDGIADVEPPRRPGPLLVAAIRLLWKRMRRLGMFASVPRPVLLRAVTHLETAAAEQAWDDEAFWGWDAAARAATIEHYRAGNDELAGRLWGRPWGDRWSDGVAVDIDLPACDPGRVADVLDAVDALVRGLQQEKEARPGTRAVRESQTAG